jgi:hypothetical protein
VKGGKKGACLLPNFVVADRSALSRYLEMQHM